jgi:hypothetical protein
VGLLALIAGSAEQRSEAAAPAASAPDPAPGGAAALPAR